ncbi:MAG: hypothetical protein ACOYLQ_03300 [Hyphomicrobiaceae bacterium]
MKDGDAQHYGRPPKRAPMLPRPVSYPPTRRRGTVILSQNLDDGRRQIAVILGAERRADHAQRAVALKS